jgi:hydrogenase maturation protein HypF
VEIFRALWKERKAGAPVADLAATAQWALALGLARIALEVAKGEGIEAIGLTGGAAVNAALTQAIKEEVERHGLRFLAHRKIPPGDGGLSFGQIVQASYLLRAKFLP